MSYNGRTLANGTAIAQTSHISDRNYVTSQALSYAQSIDKFNLDDTIYRPFGTQDLSGFMEMQGATKGIKGTEFYHVEEDWIQDLAKGTASAAAGAGAVLTLAQTTGVATAYGADPAYIATTSQTTYLLREQDVVLFPSGDLGYVQSISGANASIYPLDGTVTLGAVTATDELPVVGSLAPEGGSSVQSSNTSVFEYKNNLFRVRESHQLTGDELGSATWFNNLGERQDESAWHHEAIWNTYKRFGNKKETFGLIGNKITNTTLADLSGFETVMGSEGYIPWLSTSSNVETYSIGGWALQDLKNLITNLNKYEGAKENTLWCGFGLNTEIDDALGANTQLVNGGVIYSNVSKDRAVAFEFDSFSYGGYTFHKKHLETLDKPYGLGAVGQKYTNYGMIVPTDNITRKDMHGVSESVPSMRMVYQDRTDATMGYREWVWGGAGSNPTNGDDLMNVEMLGVCAWEFFGANRHGLFLPA